MTTLLTRLGGAAARHPWRTVALWLLILAGLLGLQASFGGQTHDDYNVPGTASQAGTDYLRDHFPEMAGTDARVIVHDPSGARLDAATLESVRSNLAVVPGASSAAPPRLSADGDTALIAVQYRVPVTDFAGSSAVDALWAAAEPAKAAGLQVELGGSVPENISAPSGVAEGIGIAVALIILVVALGSIVAAGLPLVIAIAGLGVGGAIIGLLCAVTDISATAPTIATMVGLGVGIDYALLLLSRHVDGLRQGLTPQQAAAQANGTAGVSVVIAGLTVLVALLGLKLSSLPVYASFGYATVATVGAVVLAAVTLVPALCAVAGRRLLPRSERRGGAAAVAGGSTGVAVVAAPRVSATERWAERVTRRPVAATLVSLVVLGLLAAPALQMRTWPQDAGSQPTSNTTRRAYDLVAAEYGAGANGPLVLAVDLGQLPDPTGLVRRLEADAGVAYVAPMIRNKSDDAAVIVVEPATGPQDVATTELLDRIRAEAPAGVVVTGTIGVFADISDRLADRLWIVIGFVVALSLVLLTVLLRAPVVALKAALMNLLSVAAAYGVVTAIMQTDTGAQLVGLPHATAVSSWVPILMFTVLFGLSMDYEVFLLSRVREDWLVTRDGRGSVARGLGATGRVITSAALIMVAVFLGFAFDPDVTVKTLGIGMAAAVLIDATLVRMVLVPATMALLGDANWWRPGRRRAPTPTAAERRDRVLVE